MVMVLLFVEQLLAPSKYKLQDKYGPNQQNATAGQLIISEFCSKDTNSIKTMSNQKIKQYCLKQLVWIKLYWNE